MASEKKSLFFEITAIGASLFLIYFLYEGSPTVTSIDQNLDRRYERKEFFWKGQKIREELDSNNDGRSDIWRIFQSGKPFELRLDTNLDGRSDAWARYGKDGELTTYWADINHDGRTDFSKNYIFRKKK